MNDRGENITEAKPSMPVEVLGFDDNPLASASIAQVHAAVMPDGREVVVKAVRPGIEKIIRQDLALLFTIAKLVMKYSPDG